MENNRKVYNPASRVALYCWLTAIAGVIVFFLPLVLSIDTYGAGPAMFFIGLVIFLTGFISALVFMRMANNFKDVISGKDLLAHWTYSKEEWSRYTEAEHARNRKDKWNLFKLIAIIAVVVGVVFVIIKHDALLITFCVIAGLIALIALTASLSIASDHRRNLKYPGEVYLGTKGAIFNRTLHYWKLPLTYLHSVKYVPDEVPYIDIEYSGQSGTARAFYTARIPIPAGRENEAMEIVNKLSPPKDKNAVI
jgi:hypothetical protein